MKQNPATTATWIATAAIAADGIVNRWPELTEHLSNPYPVEYTEIRAPRSSGHMPLNAGASDLAEFVRTLAADLIWLTVAETRTPSPRTRDTAARWRWLGAQILQLPDTTTSHRIARETTRLHARLERFLGYTPPIRRLPGTCPSCGLVTLVADLERWLAICTYPDCKHDDTGKPYRAELPDVNALPAVYTTG